MSLEKADMTIQPAPLPQSAAHRCRPARVRRLLKNRGFALRFGQNRDAQYPDTNWGMGE